MEVENGGRSDRLEDDACFFAVSLHLDLKLSAKSHQNRIFTSDRKLWKLTFVARHGGDGNLSRRPAVPSTNVLEKFVGLRLVGGSASK
jgi:hypothetical protein